MNQFFSATDVHIEDRCLLDAAEAAEQPMLVSLGIDNMIFRRNLHSGQEDRFTLEQETTFDAMALAPDAAYCFFGGKNSAVLQFNFADASTVKLCDVTGAITALKYAPSGKYIAIGSEEGKPLIYDPNTGRREKCRPGHVGSVYSISVSRSGYLLASIGEDQNVLIYKVNQTGQPLEAARYPITKLDKCRDISCSFSFNETALFVGGNPQLQKLECIENRWDYSKSRGIAHSTDIIMVEVVKPNTLVTSTRTQFCVWNIRQEEKLFEIEQFCLTRVVPIAGRFYGAHNDGKIYEYRREIREEEPMDIEPENASDRIDFEEQSAGENEEGEEEEAEEEKKELEYRMHKKSKAEKMISCMPQPTLSNATQPFNENRFLFVNHYGCVIERQEGDEERLLEVELEGNKKQMKFLLGKNRNYSKFCLNELGAVYAGEAEFGFRPSAESSHEEWQLLWGGVDELAMGAGWVAAIAMNVSSEIKVFDMASHEIRSWSFDRQVVAMRGFENILAVVYHESVPMWDCQQLSMQLFLVDSQIRQVSLIANAHVPVTRKSLLRWFDFSREGMIFSQDSAGVMRAFSLETNEWTEISVDSVEEIRKVWIIGIKNHAVNYWKTTDADPEPTVAPRFQVKTSEFSIPTVGNQPEETRQIYEKLLWRRYVLDHEKARTRLWGVLKLTRQKQNHFFPLSDSILPEKRIAQLHVELDQKYFPLIERYLKVKEHHRAFLMAQSCIRSMEVSRKLVDLFDYENQRSLAIQFEEYCDEKQKEIDYEQMQIFEFMKLREEAERCIKPRSEDPMKRTTNRKAESIPSFSQSSINSQEFPDHSDRHNSKMGSYYPNSISSPPKEADNNQQDNPFLKKKSNNDSVEIKKKEISDQIEKFGAKQKADKRIGQKNISK